MDRQKRFWIAHTGKAGLGSNLVETGNFDLAEVWVLAEARDPAEARELPETDITNPTWREAGPRHHCKPLPRPRVGACDWRRELIDLMPCFSRERAESSPRGSR